VLVCVRVQLYQVLVKIYHLLQIGQKTRWVENNEKGFCIVANIGRDGWLFQYAYN
jgi:hypothetical protein